MSKYQRTKLAIALSHAILEDQVNYRIAKEDAIAAAAEAFLNPPGNRDAIEHQGYDDGVYPSGEGFTATIDAGGP